MLSVGLMQTVIGTVDLFLFRHGLFRVCIEDFGAGFACTWVYSEYWLETALGSSVSLHIISLICMYQIFELFFYDPSSH